MKAADKVVKIWDVDHGELIRTLEGHSEGISDVAWSHDGEFLASASDDKTIYIWSIEEVCVLQKKLWEYTKSLAFSLLWPKSSGVTQTLCFASTLVRHRIFWYQEVLTKLCVFGTSHEVTRFLVRLRKRLNVSVT